MTKLQSVRRTVMISEPMKIFTARQVVELSAMVCPDRFSTRESSRAIRLHDISFHQGVLPSGESGQLMKQIKEVIDPKGLMNPGKIS